MRNEIKNILQVALVAVLIVAAFAWANVNSSLSISATAWAYRILSLLAAAVLAAVLIRDRFRKEDLPDHLRSMVPRPFEINGLCFGFVTEATDGRGELHVLFQNRFANPCNVRLILARHHGFVSSARLLEFPQIHIECEGGAFGMVRVPLAVPRKWQGKRKTFSIKGLVKYPNGRGKLLRYRGSRATDIG